MSSSALAMASSDEYRYFTGSDGELASAFAAPGLPAGAGFEGPAAGTALGAGFAAGARAAGAFVGDGVALDRASSEATAGFLPKRFANLAGMLRFGGSGNSSRSCSSTGLAFLGDSGAGDVSSDAAGDGFLPNRFANRAGIAFLGGAAKSCKRSSSLAGFVGDGGLAAGGFLTAAGALAAGFPAGARPAGAAFLAPPGRYLISAVANASLILVI